MPLSKGPPACPALCWFPPPSTSPHHLCSQLLSTLGQKISIRAHREESLIIFTVLAFYVVKEAYSNPAIDLDEDYLGKSEEISETDLLTATDSVVGILRR